LPEVQPDDRAVALRLLANRRHELVGLRTQAVCRIHRDLVNLLPGGASRSLTAKRAKELLATVRPRDEVGRLRRRLIAEQIADLVAIDRRLDELEEQIKVLVAKTPTHLTELFGVGPVTTARVIGEVGDVARFRSRHHFASYNGTAPVDSSSGGPPAYRLNTKGNRKLNHAIHMVAITQIRNDCAGRDFFLRKQAEGKSPKEAVRALKRRISDAIYRQLVADAEAERDPGGQVGTTPKTSVTGPTPTTGSSVRPQPGPRRKATPQPVSA
jgi:transposase